MSMILKQEQSQLTIGVTGEINIMKKRNVWFHIGNRIILEGT